MNKKEFIKKYAGFYKVDSRGFGYVTGVFFNPVTCEVITGVIFDIDDPRNENEDLKMLQSNDNVTKLYNHFKGKIEIGDEVVISRGRKFKNEKKRVVKKFTYKIDGMYGRNYGNVDYLIFDDNTKVAEHNCDLVKKYDELLLELTGNTREFYQQKLNEMLEGVYYE